MNKKVKQVQIRSFGLKNYTVEMNKKIFTGDQKRILLPDKTNFLANGHWRDVGIAVLPEKETLGRMCLEVLREEYRKKLCFLPIQE